MILSIHGSGEEGTNNTSQLTVGLGPYVSAHATTFPAVVVFPQLPTDNDGHTGPASVVFEDQLPLTAFNLELLEVNADRTRLYINGNSLGGFRTWELLYKNPTLWAGGIITSAQLYAGGLTGDPSTSTADGLTLAVTRLATMPIHTYHGDADTQVSVQGDRDINTAFHGPTATFRYTEYAGLGHGETWDAAYSDPATWSWLFAQHR
jgi:predicted peptidase